MRFQEVSPTPVPTPEFVGEFLLDSPENQQNELLAPYRPGGSRSDMPFFNFYFDFCTIGKPAHIETQYPDLSSVVETIHKAG